MTSSLTYKTIYAEKRNIPVENVKMTIGARLSVWMLNVLERIGLIPEMKP